MACVQGRWYGLYPASGIELIETEFDAASGTLTATKLTGNDFVRAGRVTWTASDSSCQVVSSLWAGAFTPRWDPCVMSVEDRDHMTVTLKRSDGDESLMFVRASLPLLMQWEEPGSPAAGFIHAMFACGLQLEDMRTSIVESLWEVLHHTQGTVLLDQLLLLLPLLMLGGTQLIGVPWRALLTFAPSPPPMTGGLFLSCAPKQTPHPQRPQEGMLV